MFEPRQFSIQGVGSGFRFRCRFLGLYGLRLRLAEQAFGIGQRRRVSLLLGLPAALFGRNLAGRVGRLVGCPVRIALGNGFLRGEVASNRVRRPERQRQNEYCCKDQFPTHDRGPHWSTGEAPSDLIWAINFLM